MGAALYLDDAATTAPDRRVLDAMLPWMGETHPGNPHARHHTHGRAAYQAVQKAREQIAAAIGATADQIIFTSGATESNHLALRGLRRHLRQTGRTHIITTQVEHSSILGMMDELREDGFTITILPVQKCGMIEADMIAPAITPQTGLVVVQAVNNELGVIQPLAEIAIMLAGRGVLLHVDAAQALGRIPVDLAGWNADFISFSAHKIHGPQGIGALYIKDDGILNAMTGGQEKGLRAGTIPVALCAGFGAACAFIDHDRDRLQRMRDAFLAHLSPLDPVVYGHADPVWNVPGILNLRFPGIDHETLVSHVITAIAGADAAAQAIRLSFGRMTLEQDLHRAADMILSAVTDIKTMKEVA
jgi:cysteine desulfurase